MVVRLQNPFDNILKQVIRIVLNNNVKPGVTKIETRQRNSQRTLGKGNTREYTNSTNRGMDIGTNENNLGEQSLVKSTGEHGMNNEDGVVDNDLLHVIECAYDQIIPTNTQGMFYEIFY